MLTRVSLQSLARYIQPPRTMANLMNKAKMATTSSSTSQKYKIAQHKASSLDNGFKAEVDVGEHKVLLLKTNDQLSALAPKCTHYGAPLVKGVLTSDGRITCPWHGACFNACTGDIEDAPALDSLTKYKVTVEDDAIYVEASVDELKKGTRQPIKTRGKKDTDQGVVIVGGGASGLACAEGLRQAGYEGSVTILTKEPNLPIDRTKLSKAFITDPKKIELRSEEQLKELNVTVQQKGASGVNKEKKTVQLEDGSEISYDKLVLAVGAYPNDLPIDGFKLEGVHKLRDITHAQGISKDIGEDKSKHLVIIGGSFIGMEAANGLVGKVAAVTIIEPNYPVKPVLGEKIAQRLVKSYTDKGIKFVIGEGSVKKINASDKDPSRVGSVDLENGSTIQADVIICAVGVKPATQFLKDTFDVQKDGGIDVGQDMLVKGEKDIYAIGDIARFVHPGTETTGRIEHWNVAQNLGRAAANHIAGHPTEYKKVPVFWSAMGAQLRYSGHATDYDDVVIQGSLEDLKFAAFYTKGEKVLAAASMGHDPDVMQTAELLRAGKMLTASQLREGKSVLDVSV